MTINPRPAARIRRPVRVVHLVTTLAIGGLEKVVLDLVRCRTRDVFGAHVVCLDSAGVLEQRLADLGVPVDVIGTDWPVAIRIVRLARRLRQLKPDVLHTHNPQAHLHGSLAARLAGVPVVVHTRHGRDTMERPVLATISRLASRWTSGFVGVSEDAVSVAREVEGVADRKLRVIHNGIDMDHFAARGPRPAQTAKRAVTVGRLDPVKDQGTLLQALRRVVDMAPAFRLDIVGEGPSRGELEALRDALGLADHVRFLGYQEHVAPYLAEADFFVLSSISEGVSIALLEAMASGLPAVATEVGGNREVVVPGETGYLVPARSPEILAEVMLRMQSDAAGLERMGCAARLRVESAFNLRTVVEQYEGLYLECLERNGADVTGLSRGLAVKAFEVHV
ncbi:MAG: glycosyltransferase [Acidobacteria bacterium]|nr:glycosyltransferase [Acidobacteriota bacterium]